VWAPVRGNVRARREQAAAAAAAASQVLQIHVCMMVDGMGGVPKKILACSGACTA
jgi:hypothetical protein